MRYCYLPIVLAAALAGAQAQERLSLDLKPERRILDAEPTPSPTPSSAKPGEKPPGTEITSSREASFDEKARKAIFEGDVKVVDPEFTMTSDRLTVFLKRSAVGKGGSDQTQKTDKAENKGESNGNPGADNGRKGEGKKADGSGAIERAIAEGSVVFIRETADEKGEVTRSVGKAAKAEFDGATGDVTLLGWPQVQQGINAQVATEESTVIILNQNGRMTTRGRSKTVITEEATEGRGS